MPAGSMRAIPEPADSAPAPPGGAAVALGVTGRTPCSNEHLN